MLPHQPRKDPRDDVDSPGDGGLREGDIPAQSDAVSVDAHAETVRAGGSNSPSATWGGNWWEVGYVALPSRTIHDRDGTVIDRSGFIDARVPMRVTLSPVWRPERQAMTSDFARFGAAGAIRVRRSDSGSRTSRAEIVRSRRAGPRDPRGVAEQLEGTRLLSRPDREQFRGYGVVGIPFASGHLLAMRRFPASSVGPGYTSLWHRRPSGRWAFYQDQPPLLACPRAFGPAIDEAVVTDIGLDWTGATEFTMVIERPIELRWHVALGATTATRALSAIASATPGRIRRTRAFAELAGRVASVALRAGRLRLVGEVPSGQEFHADMREIWMIDRSDAVIDRRDLGAPAPLPEQTRLSDFWLPQRGLFAFGDGLFVPYNPSRHRQAATRHQT